MRCLGDAGDPGGAPAVEDGCILGRRDPSGGLIERRRGRCPRRLGRRPRAPTARPRIGRAARPGREPAAAGRSTPSPGTSETSSARPRFVAECSQPLGPSKSTSFRAARAGVSRSRASSSRTRHPFSEIGACSRSRWLIGRSLAGCRCRVTRFQRAAPPSGASSSVASSSDSSPCSTMSPSWKRIPLAISRHRGVRRRRNSRSMREVLELLTLSVAHDPARLRVGLDGEPLLIPADRLRLLGQRGAQACEGPRLLRQLVGGLVILIESHHGILSASAGLERGTDAGSGYGQVPSKGRRAARGGGPSLLIRGSETGSGLTAGRDGSHLPCSPVPGLDSAGWPRAIPRPLYSAAALWPPLMAKPTNRAGWPSAPGPSGPAPPASRQAWNSS